MMKVLLTLLTFVTLLTGCDVTWRDQWAVDSRYAAVIAAQTRRAQMIEEIERLERLLRRTLNIDDRAVVQSQINRARFEVEQLNAIIER